MLTTLLFVHAFLVQHIGGSPTTDKLQSTATIPLTLTPADSCTDIDGCRTRYNIIWSSLVTILACVWTAVHRNIPEPAKAEESRLRHVAARVLEVAKIVVVTLLAPEWVLAWAVRQLLNARAFGKELEDARDEAARAWKTKRWVDEREGRGGSAGADKGERIPMRHRYLKRQAFDGSSLAVDEGAGRMRGRWTTRHWFFVIMGGFHYYEEGEPKHPLSRENVLGLVKTGDLVPPADDEIRGWSQGDALSKTLAVVQTLWFVIQCIARRVEGLPIMQLEVMTLAYTIMTVAMYAAWWDKPQNVGSPVRVVVKKLPESELPQLEHPQWYEWVFVVTAGWQDIFVDLRTHPRVPTFYGGGTNSDLNDTYADVIASGAAMVFGAVHCAAWNYAFPSRAEQLLWRISSVAIVVLPGAMLVSMVLMIITNRVSTYPDRTLDTVIDLSVNIVPPLFLFSGPIYVAARLLLLTLSFTTLRSLPYEAYRAVQWTVFIPHFT
ncbi:hypothetical protein BV25DRAFT_1915917 [Artomyces pyxidatus]|uniref:Uncharacterized protein n=1 Tax=Artomyces pyxidatus TaxID=48021 RepID=A0ACB8T2U6_9AGAM|nr:hypothetical protein BV25DRAFT_1915917 [Artomyces pyxidatus]